MTVDLEVRCPDCGTDVTKLPPCSTCGYRFGCCPCVHDVDPCAGCGLTDVVDGPDPAAHWDTPTGHVIVAWSCSPSCRATVEARRRPDGRLEKEKKS